MFQVTCTSFVQQFVFCLSHSKKKTRLNSIFEGLFSTPSIANLGKPQLKFRPSEAICVD